MTTQIKIRSKIMGIPFTVTHSIKDVDNNETKKCNNSLRNSSSNLDNSNLYSKGSESYNYKQCGEITLSTGFLSRISFNLHG